MKIHKLKNKLLGFTLIELLVVIAIMSILTTVTISGYHYSLKRAAIENDKALVRQLNRVLESYGIYEHNESEISNSLIEEFGKDIVVESLDFGYNIYYDTNLFEFALYDVQYVKKFLDIFYYLNLDGVTADNTGETNKIIIDFANIPEEKILIVDVEVNLEKNTQKEKSLLFKDVTILSCDCHESVDYVEYKAPNITNNTVLFYTPGVYSIIYTENNVVDYYIVYVTNSYIDAIEQNYSISIGIDVSNVSCSVFYDTSQIKLSLSDALYNIVITDCNLSEEGLESINLSDYNRNNVDRIMIILEINGSYYNVFFNDIENSYIFTFENTLKEEATNANIFFRYFGNDGVWHYSDKLEIFINKEN